MIRKAHLRPMAHDEQETFLLALNRLSKKSFLPSSIALGSPAEALDGSLGRGKSCYSNNRFLARRIIAELWYRNCYNFV
jgi:hypothetical protein